MKIGERIVRTLQLSAGVLAASILCDPVGAQQPQQTRQEWLQQTFQLSGMLLRAGTVCEEKQKEFIAWSFKVQTLDDDVRSIGKAFPELTAKWMMEGAGQMNSVAMQEGVKPACLRAYIQLMNVAVAVSNEQKGQKQGAGGR